jgi:hypothetical protein
MSCYYLGVAFRRGSPDSWNDLLVMESTGGQYVHTELFLQSGERARFYTSYDASRRPCAITCTSRRLPLLPNWEAVRFPVSARTYKVAYALILQLMTLPIPYNHRDLWQCAVPLLLPFERDLDCMDVNTWAGPGVFCSQFCLLMLRRLVNQGGLHAEPSLRQRLFAANSRGCSPNTLHQLLLETKRGGSPSTLQKKGTKAGVPNSGADASTTRE